MLDAYRSGGGLQPSRRPQLQRRAGRGRFALHRGAGARNLFADDEVKQNLREILQDLAWASARASGDRKEHSFRAFVRYLVGDDAEPPCKADEDVRLVASLKEANVQLQGKLSEMEAENTVVAVELSRDAEAFREILEQCKEGHEKMKAEMQEQSQSRHNSAEDDGDDLKDFLWAVNFLSILQL